ncbi:GNAT family N-acetyltransferase [Cryobacterium glaciale]|uniref:GNAT family N-acetyltransferase n=1 Tax=Cryobacterium glaciale TaxID=1259145 RepID=A0A4R8UWL4_9MICO|nr:GNAT family N-acetyltransferase [Cryobacterium glaciale]TFB71890.1 GNAT family N-acetyltransferase [Cryobacterium glaciale]
MSNATCSATRWTASPEDCLELQRQHVELARLSRISQFLIYDDENFPAYLLSVLTDPTHLFTRPSDASGVRGFCHLRKVDEVLFVNNIFIASADRQLGAGTKLLHETLLMGDTLCPTIELDVLESNMTARSWYQRLGFEELHRARWSSLGTPGIATSHPDIRVRPDRKGFSQIYSGDTRIGTRVGRMAILATPDFADFLGAQDFDEIVVRTQADKERGHEPAIEISIRLRADVSRVLEKLAK